MNEWEYKTRYLGLEKGHERDSSYVTSTWVL